MNFGRLEKLLRFSFVLGFVVLVATTVFEWRLRVKSPIQPVSETGQVVALKVRGGQIYVRSAEYILDKVGSFGGAGLCIGSLLLYTCSRRRVTK